MCYAIQSAFARSEDGYIMSAYCSLFRETPCLHAHLLIFSSANLSNNYVSLLSALCACIQVKRILYPPIDDSILETSVLGVYTCN